MELEEFLEHYRVEEDGSVFSIRSNKYLTPDLCKGYKKICVSIAGKRKNFTIHRLVALVYVDGDKTLTVNHIDGNKLNNHYSNLEWVTHKENVRHAIKTGLHTKRCEIWKKARETMDNFTDKQKEQFGKTGEGNPAYGKNYFEDMSEEKKQELLRKRAETALKNGTINTGVAKAIEIDGIKYKSYGEAYRQLGYTQKYIKRRILSDEYPNYRFVD
jgi:hypothetical protein